MNISSNNDSSPTSTPLMRSSSKKASRASMSTEARPSSIVIDDNDNATYSLLMMSPAYPTATSSAERADDEYATPTSRLKHRGRRSRSKKLALGGDADGGGSSGGIATPSPSGSKPAAYKCPTCRRGYCSEASLSSHLLSHEPGARRHVCPECPRTFVALGYLKLHMRAHARGSSHRRRSTESSSICSDQDSNSVCNDDAASNFSVASSGCESRTTTTTLDDGDLLSTDADEDDVVCDDVFRKLRSDEIARSSIPIDFYSF